LTRSTLVLEARSSGAQLWCAEIVILAPEDDPDRVAAMLRPAVADVLQRHAAPAPALFAVNGP